MKHIKWVIFALAISIFSTSAFSMEFSDAYAFGDHGFKSNRVGVKILDNPTYYGGVEFGLYKNPNFSDVVYSFRTPFSFSKEKWGMVIRPFFYPRTSNIDSYALGLCTKTELQVFADEDEEYVTDIGFNVTGGMQETKFVYPDGNFNKRKLGELSYELQVKQTVQKEFHFTWTSTVFQYLSDFSRATLSDATLDQNEFTSLSVIPAILSQPRWMSGVKYERFIEDEGDARGFIGYNYLEMLKQKSMHVVFIGTSLKLTPTSILQIDYNWVAQGDNTKENYFRFLLSFKF
jgi:hypothetical protein